MDVDHPSGISRYKIHSNHLIKVHLKTSKVFGNIRPSIELNLHRNIYNKRQDVNAIVHTHSPFTVGVSITSKIQACYRGGQDCSWSADNNLKQTFWFEGSCRICICCVSKRCHQSSSDQKPRSCCSRKRHPSSPRCSRIPRRMGQDTYHNRDICRS